MRTCRATAVALAIQTSPRFSARHDIEPGMLTLHADRGSSMRSKPVASLLVDLDIAKSHSRPYVSKAICTGLANSGNISSLTKVFTS